VGLRLFMVSFATGVFSVLFSLVLISGLLNSPGKTAGALVQKESQVASLGTSLAATTQVPEATLQSPSPTTSPTVLSQPAQEPDTTATATPAPTNPPSHPGSPGPPRGLAANYIGGEGVVLTWQPVAGVSYYNIYRSQLPGGGPAATYVAIGSSGAPTTQDFAVEAGQTYYYVVTASSGGLESPSSNEAAVNTR
jgi:hypothetical protein